MVLYRYQKTDTPNKLSARYGVPVCMIFRANGRTTFCPGEILRIPKWSYCACQTTACPYKISNSSDKV